MARNNRSYAMMVIKALTVLILFPSASMKAGWKPMILGNLGPIVANGADSPSSNGDCTVTSPRGIASLSSAMSEYGARVT